MTPAENCVWKLSMSDMRWSRLDIKMPVHTHFHASCMNNVCSSWLLSWFFFQFKSLQVWLICVSYFLHIHTHSRATSTSMVASVVAATTRFTAPIWRSSSRHAYPSWAKWAGRDSSPPIRAYSRRAPNSSENSACRSTSPNESTDPRSHRASSSSSSSSSQSSSSIDTFLLLLLLALVIVALLFVISFLVALNNLTISE